MSPTLEAVRPCWPAEEAAILTSDIPASLNEAQMQNFHVTFLTEQQ